MMIEALTVAAGAVAYNEVIKPIIKDAALKRIKEAFTPGPHQHLATLTWRLACKAQEDFNWEPDANALSIIVNQVREANGSIDWNAWTRTVLPGVFPSLSVDLQAISAWNHLVADMLNGDLKDKFLADCILRIEKEVNALSTVSSGEHALLQATLAEHGEKISKLYDLLRCHPNLHSAGIVANMTATQNDSLVKDGQTILSLQSVPAWNTNDVIIQAEGEFRQIQIRYEALHERWLNNRSDEAVAREFDVVASEYYEARKQFIKLKQDVFNDLCRAITLSLQKNTSERLGLAYSHIMQGDYERANSFLALDDITAEIDSIYTRRDAIEQAHNILEAAEVHTHNEMLERFKELMEGASISRRLAKSEYDWVKIERYYSMALSIAIDFDLPKATLLEYAVYLDEQRKVSKAIEIIKKIHEYLSDLTPQQKAEFYHVAANLELKAGGSLGEVVYCFNNAFSYWLDLTKERISEDQQVKLADLFMDVGHFWNRVFLNARDNESVFAEAYALLVQSRKVIHNVIDALEGKIATTKGWLLNLVLGQMKSDRKLREDGSYEKNMHRLMNSRELLAGEAYNYAYIVNEPVTLSENSMNRYNAYCNRADILADKGGVFLEYSNHHGEGYLAESLLYFAMAMDDLRTIADLDLSQDVFDIECKMGRIHLNVSSVFKRLQYFGKHSYEIADDIADTIVLTAKANNGDADCELDCESEERAQINKALELFDNLYQLNPLKHRSFLYTSYLMRSEFYERRDLFDEAINDCMRIIDLYKQLPADVESSSGMHRSYIESELHLAHIYMRDRLNIPKKAVPHFENAINTCVELAVKLPDEYEWKLVEIYTEVARAYGALSEFDKAKAIVFDKSYSILLHLLSSDHRCNDGMWDKWLSVVELFYGRMQQEFEESSLDGAIWIDWINTTWTYLIESYNKWLEELKKDVNILLPIVCRYVDEDGKEDFVVKQFQEQYETNLFRIVRTLTAMFMCYDRRDEAIEILTSALETYNVLSLRIAANAGILRHSAYFHEVRKNEYKKLKDLLNLVDHGAFGNAVSEFHQLESRIVFEHANPVESDGMTWEDLACTCKEMLSIAGNNKGFASVYKDDIADCYGHLGYVLFMSGNPSDAEKYLALKVATIKEIETYDLPNEYAFLMSLVQAQMSLGNFYSYADDFVKAMEIWREALDSQVEFVRKHGNSVIDSTKSSAGFVGSLIPLVDARIVNEILRNMSYTLEDCFNSEGPDRAKMLFEENWESIKAICKTMPQPVFSLIPFLFYEFIFGAKDDLDIVKNRYKELVHLVEKHDTELSRRVKDKKVDTEDALFPMDTSKRTLAFYTFIKNFLMDKRHLFCSELDTE